jgi:hypothetical protein
MRSDDGTVKAQGNGGNPRRSPSLSAPIQPIGCFSRNSRRESQDMAFQRIGVVAMSIIAGIVGYVQDLHNKPRTFELSLMYRL